MSPVTPCSCATRHAATEVVRIAGWQLRVEVRSSAGPSKHRRARSYPSRSLASSNVRRAVGKACRERVSHADLLRPLAGEEQSDQRGTSARSQGSRARPQSRLLVRGGNGRTKPDNRAMIEVRRPPVQPEPAGRLRAATCHDARRAPADPAPRPLRGSRAGAGAALAGRSPAVVARGPGGRAERLGARPGGRRGAPRDRRSRPGRALVPLVARLAPHPLLAGPGRRREPPPDGGRGRRRPHSRPDALHGGEGRADRGAAGHPRPRPRLDEPARPLGLRRLPPDAGDRTAPARRPQPGQHHRLARRPGGAPAGGAGADAGGRLRAAGARRRGRRVPGRRRVRQRGRRARVRLHARRRPAVGGERPRLRPGAARRARPGRRL